MNVTPLMLALLLSGCGGGSNPTPEVSNEPSSEPAAVPGAEGADPHASVDPTTAPAVAPPSDAASPEAARRRAVSVVADMSSLTRVEAEAESGGDLTRSVVGYKRGDELVLITDVQDVGEYGRVEVRYVLESGAIVVRMREGFSHDPIEGQDSRFKKFEEQVVLGAGGVVLEARERAAYTDGHPTESTALPAGWTPIENADVGDAAEVLALFN